VNLHAVASSGHQPPGIDGLFGLTLEAHPGVHPGHPPPGSDNLVGLTFEVHLHATSGHQYLGTDEGARIQVQPGLRPHTLRGEGPESDSREIFSGSQPSKRSSSGVTGIEAGRILMEPGKTPGEVNPFGTGNISESAQLYPSEGRPLGFSNPFGVSNSSQGNNGWQPPVVADRRVTGPAPPQLTQGDMRHRNVEALGQHCHPNKTPGRPVDQERVPYIQSHSV
jgi:hypothetical protein